MFTQRRFDAESHVIISYEQTFTVSNLTIDLCLYARVAKLHFYFLI